MYEAKLEGFIEKVSKEFVDYSFQPTASNTARPTTQEGSTVLEFFTAIREAQEVDEHSEEATLGTIMLATTDYSVFMQMMRDFKEGQLKSSHK